MTACALLFAYGCKSTSDRGGGAADARSFKIAVPAKVSLSQGETKTVTVSLDRGDFFKRDVRLTMQVSGQGVQVQPSQTVVQADQPGEVQVRVSADTNAAIGEYRVRVVGTPEQGAPTSVSFPVQVSAP